MSNGSPATATVNPPGISFGYAHVNDAFGKEYAEINTTQSKVDYNNFWLGDRIFAKYDPSYGTVFLHPSSIGSTATTTGPTNSPIGAEIFYPWGQSWGTGGALEEERFAKFRQRDAGTGLDYTLNRMYPSWQGRWLTPDPGGRSVVKLDDPQTWNMYAYAQNTPFTLTDPSGLRQCSGDESVHTAGCEKDSKEGQTHSCFGGDATCGNNGEVVSVHGARNAASGDALIGGGVGAVVGVVVGLATGAAEGTGASGLWSLGPAARGGVIEDMLGANLPRTFPVVDAFENGVVTSIKSIDLTAPTYQAPEALASKLAGYVDKLAEFQGGKVANVAIDASQVTGKVLKVAVPEGGVSAAQQAVINRVAAEAAQKGVSVVVVRVR